MLGHNIILAALLDASDMQVEMVTSVLLRMVHLELANKDAS